MDISSNKKLKHPEIAHRLKAIRKTQKKSQQYIADLLGIGVPKMINIENSRDEYDQSDIDVLVKDLGVEGVPLTDEEVDLSLKMTVHLSDLIASGRLEEAKTHIEKLSPVLKLINSDPELVMLYKQIKADFLLSQGETEKAKEIIKLYDRKVDKMDARNLYHYYHNKGRVLFRALDYKKAMISFKKAREISENNKNFDQILIERATSNVGNCYSALGFPNAAIIFLEEVNRKNPENRSETFRFHTNISLSLSYAEVGVFTKSKELLTKTLNHAQHVGNKFHIGLAYYAFGKMHFLSEDWEKGIESCDKALKFFEFGSEYRMWSYTLKICCLLNNGKFKLAENTIKEAKALYPNHERGQEQLGWLQAFHSISKGITQPKEKEVEYMLNHAIPHLLKSHFKFEAMSTVKLIIRHFEKTSQVKRVREMYELLIKIKDSLISDIN